MRSASSPTKIIGRNVQDPPAPMVEVEVEHSSCRTVLDRAKPCAALAVNVVKPMWIC
jgi:hypothetical protein